MRKTLISALVVVAVLSSLAGEASAIGRRRQRNTVYVAPATPAATAQATPSGTGYRTYSYEPSAATTGFTTMRTTRVPPYMNAGRHSAGYKLTDF